MLKSLILKSQLLTIRVKANCGRNNRVLIVPSNEALDIKDFHKAKIAFQYYKQHYCFYYFVFVIITTDQFVTSVHDSRVP